MASRYRLAVKTSDNTRVAKGVTEGIHVECLRLGYSLSYSRYGLRHRLYDDIGEGLRIERRRRGRRYRRGWSIE